MDVHYAQRFFDWLDVQLKELPSHALRFAEWLDAQVDFRQAPPTAPGGVFVDKQGRWRDARTGRFVDMPVQPRNAPLGRRVIRDVNESKLLQLSGADAYNATVQRLKAKYRDNPEALKIIDELGLDKGVSNKNQSRQLLARTTKALQDDAALGRELADRVGAMKPEKARAVIDDVDKLKLLQLSGVDAYSATVQRLRRKYRDDSEALALINSLGINGGVGRKAQTEARLERVRGLIKDEPSSKPQLRHNLRDIKVSPTQVSPDDRLVELEKRLREADVDSMTNSQKSQLSRDRAALNAVLGYRQSVTDLNNLVDEVNGKPRMSREDYEGLFETRNRIWAEMKGALDEAQGLKNQFLSDSVLDEYVGKMQKVSRESPGGFKIAVPADLDGLKARAAALPC